MDGLLSKIGTAISGVSSSGLLKFIFIVFLIYAFGGLFAFLPFVLAILGNVLKFPLDFLNNNVYPVGSLPYLMLSGLVIFFVVSFLIKLFTKD